MGQKVILLANIGNRSLIYKEKPENKTNFFIGDINDPKEAFREKTDAILKSGDFSEVQINILDALLKHGDLKNEITDIYLFTSNQIGEDNRKKDTLHAGEIIAKLIKDDFKIKNVVAKEMTGILIIDADKLIRWYRDFFDKLPKKDTKFILCDSGGTPQQKTALKLVAEYFLEKGTYEYYQIIEPAYEDGESPTSSKVLKLNNLEYRNIISAQQAELLIMQGNYAAAVLLFQAGNIVIQVLKFCDERLNGIVSTITSNIQLKPNFPKTIISNSAYAAYANWDTVFSQSDYYFVCEALSVADFYLQKENWTRFALATQNFIERFVNKVLFYKAQNSHTLAVAQANPSNKCACNRKWEKCMLIKDIPTAINEKLGLNGLKDKLGCICTFVVNPNLLKSIINTFVDCHSAFHIIQYSAGLDKLRNGIAHEGLGVKSQAEIIAQVPDIFTYFQNWKTELGLPTENVFISANNEIIAFLKHS